MNWFKSLFAPKPIKEATVVVDDESLLSDKFDDKIEQMRQAFESLTTDTYESQCPVYYDTRRAKWDVSKDGKVEKIVLSNNGITKTMLYYYDAEISDTSEAQSNPYREEMYVVYGTLFDKYADKWLTAGTYIDRPAGDKFGPYWTKDNSCIVHKVLHRPNQPMENDDAV